MTPTNHKSHCLRVIFTRCSVTEILKSNNLFSLKLSNIFLFNIFVYLYLQIFMKWFMSFQLPFSSSFPCSGHCAANFRLYPPGKIRFYHCLTRQVQILLFLTRQVQISIFFLTRQVQISLFFTRRVQIS